MNELARGEFTDAKHLPRFERRPPPNSSKRRSKVTFSWRTRGSADLEDLSFRFFLGVGDLAVWRCVDSSLRSFGLSVSLEGLLRGDGSGCGIGSGVSERGGGELDLIGRITNYKRGVGV